MQNTENFCLGLWGIDCFRSRALANYVMGLCSSPSLRSPVEITNSPFCHYTYSNLTKVLHFSDLTREKIIRHLSAYIPPAQVLSNGQSYYHLSHDFTTLLKPHSACLPGRGYVVTANPVAQNISLSAGYAVSALHLNVPCAAPLLLEKLDVSEDKTAAVLDQIKAVMTHSELPFQDFLTLFTADSAYGKASIISPLYDDYQNMVCILRMRAGMKVWTAYRGEQARTGTKRIYGEKYYLRPESKHCKDAKSGKETIQIGIGTLAADQVDSYPMTMKNGRAVIVSVKRWNNMLIRSKGTAKMKDKPIDILHVSIIDAQSQVLVFNRPMFLAVTGKQKSGISSQEAQQGYRGRFDVEGAYRFMKQNLLMGKLQSPDIEHQDNWLKITQLSYWLLAVAAEEIQDINIPVWQKYLKSNKCQEQDPNKKRRATLSQTQKSIASLFYTFDQTPFLPQKCKKGKGRQEGTKLTPRNKHPIAKESEKKVLKS